MWKQMGDEFKVGVFTLTALFTLGYMLLVLNPNMLSDSKRVQYYTIVNDAGGIIPKTHVKTNGVTVGKVRAVELEVSTTKIIVEIDGNIKLPVGSKIEIRTRGLLGDVYLEIVRVSDAGQYISPGGLIPRSEDQMDMQGMMALLGNIGKDVKRITGTLANVVGSNEGEKSFANIIDNIESVSLDLRKTASAIRGAVGDDPQGIKNIVTNLNKSLANFKEFTGNLNNVLDDSNRERLNRIIASFDDSMSEVKGATKNIRLISDKIEKGEGTIGKLINDDTAIVEIESTLKDLREAISPVTKTVITLDAHAEARADKTGQSYLNVMMRMRPDRFYLIGVTAVNESVRDTRTESIDTDSGTADRPASTKIRERVVERRATRYNIQLAKSWYFVTARMGIFESTGGTAVDFNFFHEKLRFSLEAFDFKSYDNEWRRVARLKAYMQVLFLDHIYLMAGVDDITRKKNSVTYLPENGPIPFGGLGLAFNDQDLKALMGASALAR